MRQRELLERFRDVEVVPGMHRATPTRLIPKDYKDGVWTLPPVLRLKDKDREKYLAIGESDRMTLRFVKP